MKVSLAKLVLHIRTLGAVLRRVFKDTGLANAYVTGMYLSGTKAGVSVKLSIGQGLALRAGVGGGARGGGGGSYGGGGGAGLEQEPLLVLRHFATTL